MINTSKQYKENIYTEITGKWHVKGMITFADSRTYTLKNSDFWDSSVKIEDSVSRAGKFEIGQAAVNELTLTLQNFDGRFDSYDFYGAKIQIHIGMKLPDETIEYLNKGVWTVNEPVTVSDVITISAYDNMAKFDRDYDTPLNYPATLIQILRDCCTKCGVTLYTQNFLNDNYIANEKPSNGTTYRDMVSYVAQLAGCFARINNLGQLELKWYENPADAGAGLDGGLLSDYSTGDNADGGNFTNYSSGDSYDGGSFTDNYIRTGKIGFVTSEKISTEEIIVTGVKIKVDDTEYFSGTDKFVVSIESNPLAQENVGNLVSGLAGKLIGFAFRPMEIFALDDPSIEAGDTVWIKSKNGWFTTIVSNLTYSISGYEQFSADSESEFENQSQKYSESAKVLAKARKEIKQEVTERERAIANLANTLASSSGLYSTDVVQSDGSTIRYAHDKRTLAESMIVWKFTAQAWAVSTDGGVTYPAGFTMDGDMVARMLNVVGLNAEVIDTGELTAIVIRSKDNSSMWDLNTGRLQLTGAVKATAGDFGSPSTQAVGISYLLGGRLFLNTINDYNRGLLQLAGNGVQFMPVNCSLYLGSAGQGDKGMAPYTLNEGGENPGGYTERHIFNGNIRQAKGDFLLGGSNVRLTYGVQSNNDIAWVRNGGFYVDGNLSCGGTKHRVVKTSYGNIGMNAFETMGAHFADFGSGTIGEDGKCYVWLDPVFMQTIDPHQQYQVFTNPSAQVKKHHDYFIVHGTPGMAFDWQIVAKQRGYQNDYGERVDIETDRQIDYDMSIFNADKELESNAESYLENYYKEILNYD